MKQYQVEVDFQNGTSVTTTETLPTGNYKQVKAYVKGGDETDILFAKVIKAGGDVLVEKQIIENLRSRNTAYINDMPLNFNGGQIEITVFSKLEISKKANIFFVFDYEQNTHC